MKPLEGIKRAALAGADALFLPPFKRAFSLKTCRLKAAISKMSRKDNCWTYLPQTGAFCEVINLDQLTWLQPFCQLVLLHLIDAFVRLLAIAGGRHQLGWQKPTSHALYIILTFLFITLSSPPLFLSPLKSLSSPLSYLIFSNLLRSPTPPPPPPSAFLQPSVSWAFCSHTVRHVRWRTYIICPLSVFSICMLIRIKWKEIQLFFGWNLNSSIFKGKLMHLIHICWLQS